jgi:hypothetical protein
MASNRQRGSEAITRAQVVYDFSPEVPIAAVSAEIISIAKHIETMSSTR